MLIKSTPYLCDHKNELISLWRSWNREQDKGLMLVCVLYAAGVTPFKFKMREETDYIENNAAFDVGCLFKYIIHPFYNILYQCGMIECLMYPVLYYINKCFPPTLKSSQCSLNVWCFHLYLCVSQSNNTFHTSLTQHKLTYITILLIYYIWRNDKNMII